MMTFLGNVGGFFFRKYNFRIFSFYRWLIVRLIILEDKAVREVSGYEWNKERDTKYVLHKSFSHVFTCANYLVWCHFWNYIKWLHLQYCTSNHVIHSSNLVEHLSPFRTFQYHTIICSLQYVMLKKNYVIIYIYGICNLSNSSPQDLLFAWFNMDSNTLCLKWYRVMMACIVSVYDVSVCDTKLVNMISQDRKHGYFSYLVCWFVILGTWTLLLLVEVKGHPRVWGQHRSNTENLVNTISQDWKHEYF